VSKGLDKAMDFLLDKFPVTRAFNKMAKKLDRIMRIGGGEFSDLLNKGTFNYLRKNHKKIRRLIRRRRA